MAFERMNREISIERASQLNQQESIQKLIGIRSTLTDMLIRDGTEDTDTQLTHSTMLQFAGTWQEHDVQVRIYAKASKDKLIDGNKPVYVDITMGDHESKYYVNSRPGDTEVYLTFGGSVLGRRREGLDCLELGQVVDVIDGGQLTQVGK